jgi:RNA polymerase sigma-70 factor (ECF subfamily)
LSDRLDNLLAPAITEARLAWKGVGLSPASFARHVAKQLTAQPTADALARLHLTDLYLAAACAENDRRALAWFEQTFMSQVGAYIRKLDSSPAVAEEVQQLLRTRLLVGDATRPPAIATYTGRGALGAWVRIAAVRVVHDLLRARRAHVPIDDDAMPALAPGNDPELSLIKRRYAREFNEALKYAIADLPPVDRNLMRWHYVDGLTTDAIGTLGHVDGSTIRRKLAAVRRRVLDGVRARLAERLRVDDAELDSLMGLVRSRIHLSLSSQLRRR